MPNNTSKCSLRIGAGSACIHNPLVKDLSIKEMLTFRHEDSRWLTVARGFEVFGERAFHTRRKVFQNKIEERAEESDKAVVRRERFVGSTF